MSSLLKFPNIFKKNPTPADISAPQGGKRVTEVKKDQRGKLVKESIPTRWIDFLKESEIECEQENIPINVALKYVASFAAHQERSFVENKVEQIETSDDGFDSSDSDHQSAEETPINEDLGIYTSQLPTINESKEASSIRSQSSFSNRTTQKARPEVIPPKVATYGEPNTSVAPVKPTLPPKPILPKPPNPPVQRTSEEIHSEALRKIDQLCNHTEDPQRKYHTGTMLGKGGCATVYTATDRSTKDTVAVKCIDIGDQSLKLNFVHQEIKCLVNTHHRNIVNFIECFMIEELNQLWIVMECCEGGNLTDIVTKRRLREQLTEPRIAAVSHEILQALYYLHENHLIHRDIKSDNVLLELNGSIKLGDFGYCAKICQNEKRETVLGTRCWMAPEVVKGKPYDEKIDIWSFGITVLEMLDGEPPYIRSAPMKTFELIAKGRPKILRANEITAQLLNFINKSLEPDPKARASAAQLLSHKFIGEKDDLSSFAKIVRNSLTKNSRV